MCVCMYARARKIIQLGAFINMPKTLSRACHIIKKYNNTHLLPLQYYIITMQVYLIIIYNIIIIILHIRAGRGPCRRCIIYGRFDC
jgi:hypothetical protein